MHPSGDGNRHVPATGTTNSGKVLKAGATAASEAWGDVAWAEVATKPTIIQALASPDPAANRLADLTGPGSGSPALTPLTGFSRSLLVDVGARPPRVSLHPLPLLARKYSLARLPKPTSTPRRTRTVSK